MSTHDKPVPITIDTKDYKVRISVVNDERPTGLAGAVYICRGYDVNVKVTDKRTGEVQDFKRIGSLMWRPSGNCAWSLASTDLWLVANTLYGETNERNERLGAGWSYMTDSFALKGLAEFIRVNLVNGPTRLTKAMA